MNSHWPRTIYQEMQKMPHREMVKTQLGRCVSVWSGAAPYMSWPGRTEADGVADLGAGRTRAERVWWVGRDYVFTRRWFPFVPGKTLSQVAVRPVSDAGAMSAASASYICPSTAPINALLSLLSPWYRAGQVSIHILV